MISDDSAVRAQLRARVVTRRAEVQRYVRRTRPWSNRLGTVSVISGGLVALTTAGPALGGDPLLAAVAGSSETVGLWQGACVVALVVSLVSTVSSGLLRHQDVAGRVAAAEAAAAELGALTTALDFGRVDLDEAVGRYQQTLATTPFVEEDPAAAPAAPAPEPTTSLLATPARGLPAPRGGPAGPPTGASGRAAPHRVPAWGPPPGPPRRG